MPLGRGPAGRGGVVEHAVGDERAKAAGERGAGSEHDRGVPGQLGADAGVVADADEPRVGAGGGVGRGEHEGERAATAAIAATAATVATAATAATSLLGNLSDRFGRRPVMIVGSLSSGALSFAYLYAISQKNVALTVLLAIVMWGVLYQMWNATFASYFQELFPTRTRVTGFAVSQNVGLAITAFLPTVFAIVAPPGSADVPLIIGGISFALTVIGAAAAWSAKETHRIPLDELGNPDAVPVARDEFARIRAAA